MNRFRNLRKISRDRSYLVKLSCLMVGVALMGSGVIWSIKPQKNIRARTFENEFIQALGADIEADLSAEDLAAIIRNRALFALKRKPEDYREVVYFNGDISDISRSYSVLEKRVKSSVSINEGERERLLLLLQALHRSGEQRNLAIERLNGIEAGKRYRNEFLGDAYWALGKPLLAIESYIQEGLNYPKLARYSQRSAIIACIQENQSIRLKAIIREPGFKTYLSLEERVDASILARDYIDLFWSCMLLAKDDIVSFGFLISLLAATIWFFVYIAIGAFDRRVVIFSIGAVLLGFLSVVLTIFSLKVQEQIFNYEFPTTSFVDQLYENFIGVAFREEVCKLLCFVPVLLLIIRFRQPLLVLITASMTGLGFACLENVGYYYTNQAAGVVGISSTLNRLLTANALHIALTGIVGFSVYKVIINRGRGWENFLIDFFFVVLVHGAYNSFLSIPQIVEYNFVTFIVLVLVLYRFLDLLREHINFSGIYNRVSPLGILVIGTVLFACVTMLINTWNFNLKEALSQFLGFVVTSFILCFVFVNRLRDL